MSPKGSRCSDRSDAKKGWGEALSDSERPKAHALRDRAHLVASTFCAGGHLLALVITVGMLGAMALAQTPPEEPAVGEPGQTEAEESPEAPTSQPVAEEEEPKSVLEALLTGERATGDWGGARPWLEECGVTFDMTLTTFFQSVAHGGLNTRRAHTILGVNALELTLDLGKMKLIPGGTMYVYATNSWGESPTTRGWTGDLFDVNGIELGNHPINVHELWYEQALLDNKLRVRFGRIMLPNSFDTNAFAFDTTLDFTNWGLNHAANIPFPAKAWGAIGAQAFFTPCDWFHVGAGLADAQGELGQTGFHTAFHEDGYFFSIYEFGFTPKWETGWGKLPGNYRLGLWHDPQPKPVFFDDLGGRRQAVPMRRDDVGFYTSLDQMIFRENPAVEGDEQGLGLFFRYSHAHGDVNTIEDFWSVGGQYRGLLPTRDDDVLGVGVAQGILSDELRRTGADPHRETAIEVYYNIQLLPWLSLAPDFQWILCPGGENGRDAFVAGLRLKMAF